MNNQNIKKKKKLTNIIITEGFGINYIFRRHVEASEGEGKSQTSTRGSTKGRTIAEIVDVKLQLSAPCLPNVCIVVPAAGVGTPWGGYPTARFS